MINLPTAPGAVSHPADEDLSAGAPVSAVDLSINSTIALPITAASANWPTWATCSALLMPNPTATGSVLHRRMRATSAAASDVRLCYVPVMPTREMA